MFSKLDDIEIQQVELSEFVNEEAPLAELAGE